jgi:hypothetical protein
MPIIINEFEIVPEPESKAPAPATAVAPTDEMSVPEPDDIVRVQRLAWQRSRRIWAD